MVWQQRVPKSKTMKISSSYRNEYHIEKWKGWGIAHIKIYLRIYSQFSRILKIWLSSDRYFGMIPTFDSNIRYCRKTPLMISMLCAKIVALQYIFKAGDYFEHFVQIWNSAVEAIFKLSFFDNYDTHGIKHCLSI